MFCPRCAANQSNDIKFCTVCGANLQAVRQAVESPEAGKKFDWADTWVADMFMQGGSAERRKLEIERIRGITPEVKRLTEIKAGVITSSVGIGLMVFLHIFMKGIIGNVSPEAAEILNRVWIAGILPVFVGLGIIVSAVVVGKKLVIETERGQSLADGDGGPPALKAANTNEFVSSPFSVTEQTTKHLSLTDRKQ
ncbi:MAG TPA: zinc ribbon domain-containing protein [Pyrinomonadaceae bacterium]|jgi:hypothetical protein|nr:zinc ribbon domain-containing protein [Pyrinomonadaceae bacterium]